MNSSYFNIWLRDTVDKIGTVFFIGLPALVVAAIVYRRTKNAQVRICLILGYLWTVIGFYYWFEDWEQLGYYPLRFITFPVVISDFLVEWIGEIPVLGHFLHEFLHPALAYVFSFAIISSPFYIYRFISNRRGASQENDKP